MTPPIETIKFDSDTTERKKLFTAASFSHPAKMHLSLQVYLVERYTKPGDTILDPMGGSGTLLAACALGRNIILVELEQKFCKMMEKNWLKIKSLGPMLGYKMGNAQIVCGDARNLDGLLADNILFSPPYADLASTKAGGKLELRPGHKNKRDECIYSKNPHNIGNLPYGKIDTVISSPPYEGSLQSGKDGIDDSKWTNKSTKSREQARLIPKGYTAKADAVITSPPYEGTVSGKELDESEKLVERKSGKEKWGNHLRLGRSQLTKYADAVITSPPYEGMKQDDKRANDPEQIDKRAKAFEKAGGNFHTPGRMATIARHYSGYTNSNANIGNLKSENYLSAMFSVYQNCHKVLKEKGLMVLVVKNFIRDKKVIRLDLDTIKICKKAGFTLKEQLQRKLTAQSFWRIIYHNKFPDVEKIEYEDVLVFQRAKE